MKTLQSTLITLSLSLVIAAPAFAGHAHRDDTPADRQFDRIEKRLDHQQYRIERGIRNDRLTKRESKTLKKQCNRIHRLSRKYHRDGHLSRAEYRHLTHKLDENSELIREYVHNGIDRYIAYHDEYSRKHNYGKHRY